MQELCPNGCVDYKYIGSRGKEYMVYNFWIKFNLMIQLMGQLNMTTTQVHMDSNRICVEDSSQYCNAYLKQQQWTVISLFDYVVNLINMQERL